MRRMRYTAALYKLKRETMGNDIGGGLVALLVVLVVLLGVFLALRALVLWYFKIPEALERMAAIDAKLGRLVNMGENAKP